MYKIILITEIKEKSSWYSSNDKKSIENVMKVFCRDKDIIHHLGGIKTITGEILLLPDTYPYMRNIAIFDCEYEVLWEI